jgi:hypothetical protein
VLAAIVASTTLMRACRLCWSASVIAWFLPG